MNAIVRTADEGQTVAVVGDVYRFLATGAETGGAYAMCEAIVPPGGGPPPHIHSREVESFYVLEGQITVRLAERRIAAKAGAHVHVPIGVLHSFANETDRPARMLIMIAPAGLEEMFFKAGVPLAAGATTAPPASPEDVAQEIARLLELAPKYGVEILAAGA